MKGDIVVCIKDKTLKNNVLLTIGKQYVILNDDSDGSYLINYDEDKAQSTNTFLYILYTSVQLIFKHTSMYCRSKMLSINQVVYLLY